MVVTVAVVNADASEMNSSSCPAFSLRLGEEEDNPSFNCEFIAGWGTEKLSYTRSDVGLGDRGDMVSGRM